jgi:hypothetical protein
MIVFCQCGSVAQIVLGQELEFLCSKCGKKIKGKPDDRKLYEDIFKSQIDHEKYDKFLRNAAFDPVNMMIKKDCPNCFRDYMTLCRLGKSEKMVAICKCGKIA